MSTQVKSTILELNGKRVLVSTINRESSSVEWPHEYAETMAFYIVEGKTIVPMKEEWTMDDAPAGETYSHDKMVKRIVEELGYREVTP